MYFNFVGSSEDVLQPCLKPFSVRRRLGSALVKLLSVREETRHFLEDLLQRFIRKKLKVKHHFSRWTCEWSSQFTLRLDNVRLFGLGGPVTQFISVKAQSWGGVINNGGGKAILSCH